MSAMPRTDDDLARLWETVRVGSIELANRVFVPAHETQHGDRRRMSDRYVAYLAARAKGGAGLVMTGGASVHPRGERPGHLPIWQRSCIPDYRLLADAVHEHGDAKVFVQLFHCGIQDTGTDRLEDWHPVVGPSAQSSVVHDKVAKPMDEEEIADTVRHYGMSAVNMREAGIDGVEVGAGHGYLLASFLSPLTNRRTDRYGGSVENRARLLREVLEEIRRVVGTDFPIGMRMSFDELVGPRGITPDMAEEILALVHSWGILDYVNVSGINYHTIHMLTHHMAGDLDAIFADNARRARGVVRGDIPVFVASGVRTLQEALPIIEDGQADVVGMVRAHIADPDIVRKARAGRGDEIQRCVGANQGCVRRVALNGKLTCTVNPMAGREHRHNAAAPTVSPLRTVTVVGGGPAGMKAAATAAEAGHRVVLLERASALGGLVPLFAGLPQRQRWLHLVEDLEGAMRRAGVDVRLDTTATAELVQSLGAEIVLLAVGAYPDGSGFSMSVPGRDGIPGANGDHVIDSVTALRNLDAVGSRVVIVDDVHDHVGMTLGRTLAESGRDVELVTAGLQVGSQTLMTLEFPFVLPAALQAGVQITAQSYIDRIDPDAVYVASLWGEEEPRRVSADTVILHMLRQPELDLYEDLRADGIVATRIGDCLAPRDVDDAIYEGWEAGCAVAGEAIGALSPVLGAPN